MSDFELAPTADVPRTRGKERPTSFQPCPACGREVLTAVLVLGDRERVVLLDTTYERQKTYIIAWDKGADRPEARESAAYPVHRCAQSKS